MAGADPDVTNRLFARLFNVTKIQKTEQEWRVELTPEEYRILREKGTEAPFSGEYDFSFEPGTYRCAGCGAELFESETKYDSGIDRLVCLGDVASGPEPRQTIEIGRAHV